jgi:hypothetical protein
VDLFFSWACWMKVDPQRRWSYSLVLNELEHLVSDLQEVIESDCGGVLRAG